MERPPAPAGDLCAVLISVEPMPSGANTASAAYRPNSIPEACWRACARTSKPALEYSRRLPGSAITRCSSKASPEVWASRWRTVEPSGPAGSSSSKTPSSTATSAAYEVSSLVTDASGKRWSCGPCPPSTAPSAPRTTAAAACGTGQVSIIRKLSMRRL